MTDQWKDHLKESTAYRETYREAGGSLRYLVCFAWFVCGFSFGGLACVISEKL